jgi:hypothetical protein
MSRKSWSLGWLRVSQQRARVIIPARTDGMLRLIHPQHIHSAAFRELALATGTCCASIHLSGTSRAQPPSAAGLSSPPAPSQSGRPR